MIGLIFCILLLVVLIGIGTVKLQVWKSRINIIDADWLDDDAKFHIVSRWGMMR